MQNDKKGRPKKDKKTIKKVPEDEKKQVCGEVELTSVKTKTSGPLLALFRSNKKMDHFECHFGQKTYGSTLALLRSQKIRTPKKTKPSGN